MPDHPSAPNTTGWPTPKFRFEVKWDDGTVMDFQEVSGLDAEAQPIEYRHGNSPQFSVIKMPGIQKHSDVTMKKGIARNQRKFAEWLSELQANTRKRRQVTVSLLDEGGAPAMVWTLANAWLNKIAGTDLKAEGNEVAVEILVLSHEGLTVAQA